MRLHLERFKKPFSTDLFLGYGHAVEFAKDYAKIKGPGTKAKPEQHAFFRRLAPIVKRTLEKCERENGLM